MNYIKVFVGPGLIVLGIIVGGYIGIADGSGPIVGILGGLLGFMLYCMINGAASRSKSGLWSGAAGLDEQRQLNSSMKNQAIETVVTKAQEEALLNRPLR